MFRLRTKTPSRLFPIVCLALACGIGGAWAQETFHYRLPLGGDATAGFGSGSGGGGGSVPSPTAGGPGRGPTSANCYDPTNVGQVGQPGWTGCEGMLIVDDAMLRGAAGSAAGGDGSFAIASAGTTYTFADSAENIFTGQVADMSRLFQLTGFNGDIGYWDVSGATSMLVMFGYATAFDQDISGWDVSNVETFSAMFAGASSFNQDISGWDVSSSWNFQGMFRRASSFNQDISGWDTSNAIYMTWMFQDNDAFNQDIGGWDISNVASVMGMFLDADAFDQDLSAWCPASVTDRREFDKNATAWVKPRPDWTATCP